MSRPRHPIVAAVDRLEAAVEQEVSAEARAELLCALNVVLDNRGDALELLAVYAQRRRWPALADVRRWWKLSQPAPCGRCYGTGFVLFDARAGDRAVTAATRCLSCEKSRRARRAMR